MDKFKKFLINIFPQIRAIAILIIILFGLYYIPGGTIVLRLLAGLLFVASPFLILFLMYFLFKKAGDAKNPIVKLLFFLIACLFTLLVYDQVRLDGILYDEFLAIRNW